MQKSFNYFPKLCVCFTFPQLVFWSNISTLCDITMGLISRTVDLNSHSFFKEWRMNSSSFWGGCRGADTSMLENISKVNFKRPVFVSYFQQSNEIKSQNDLILQDSQQSLEVAGAASPTSVLKKFITEFVSGLTSSCSSSGGPFPSSASGAFSSSAAGLSSVAALSASGSGNDWESCGMLTVSSYMPSQRISLWEWC